MMVLSSSLKMPLSEALAVSAIGILTVIVILAIIALLIILVSKAIRAIEAKATKAPAKAAAPAPSAGYTAPAASQGQVELIDTDEKEAAVIMAIVSKKSGIPLERLSFRSIKLIDEKKGDK